MDSDGLGRTHSRGLITRRSQVQILPPLRKKSQLRAFLPGRALLQSRAPSLVPSLVFDDRTWAESTGERNDLGGHVQPGKERRVGGVR